jgi:deoxyribonuclease-4
MTILVGPAGTGGKDPENLVKIKRLGFSCVEVAFTYGVWMNNSDAKKYFDANKKLGLKLSIHAPYYINLNSKEKSKILSSKKRILLCCERGHYMGASKVVFHPGYYGEMDKEKTFDNIKKAILDIQKEIKKNKWKIELAPETTGKLNVFGSIDEISRLKRETGCSFCIDFSHVLARYKKIDFGYLFKNFNSKSIHAHISGIEYGEKGEKHHKLTPHSFLKKVINECKRRKLNVTLINESPDPVGDSLKALKMV